MQNQSYANIPQKVVGPIKIFTSCWHDNVHVPLATLESPLWHSVNRGARLSQLTEGISVVISDDIMTRSIIVEAPNNQQAYDIKTQIRGMESSIKNIVEQSSNHARYDSIYIEQVANLLYVRLAIYPAAASGHNMVTKTADMVGKWLLDQFASLKFVSVSGNLCCDKKVSAVNGVLGRGKHVIAELIISATHCQQYLKTSPQAIHALHIKKNLIGSILAGSVRSANAHFANMLLALYLATGQDGANIVEGSQGIVHCDLTDKGDLYFSVTLPNIIVGTIGNGKDRQYVRDNLSILKCLDLNGDLVENSSQRLAVIAAATVLCGEISLLAAQTIPGLLTRSHMVLERREYQHE